MTLSILLMIATAGLCALYLLIIAVRTYLRFKGPMVVTCPETQLPAGVAVDIGHAAMTALADATELRLKQCSRWPERSDCGQDCLSQIESAPENCLVREILAAWYAKKSCALCSVPFGTIHTWDHKPGLITRDGRVIECSAVPGEDLPHALASHQPLCWNCYVAEEFRRRNPELVIDRPVRFHPSHTGAPGKAG